MTAGQGLAPFAGLAIGLAFGFVVRRGNFCAMGGIADLALFGDGRRLRAWLLAAATALAGFQALHLAGLVEPAATLYHGGRFTWLGVLAGGLAFGYGMTLTGGCVSQNLVRLGGGSLRALIVLLVLGIAAAAALTGVLAPLGRLGPTAPDLAFGPPGSVLLGLTAAAGLLAASLGDRRFRASPRDRNTGLALGGLVVLAWMTVAALGDGGAEEGLTFVAPAARALTASVSAPAAVPGFGAGVLAGVVLGGFAAARVAGTFRVEGFSGLDDLRRHLAGAVLMGVGGALAGGCTVGQGMTGTATLASSSALAVLAIVAGGFLGIAALQAGGALPLLRQGTSRLSGRARG